MCRLQWLITVIVVKVVILDRNKYVSKTLQYFVSVLEYLGFVGPWVSAVLSLVFHWGLAVVRTLSNPLSVGPDFSGHLTIL